MRGFIDLLALPSALLALSLAQSANAQELPWPYNLPRTAKYYPEDEAHVKRGLEVQERLAIQTPVGVKKMGHDPGEKFFFDYWNFGLDQDSRQDTTVSSSKPMERVGAYANATDICQLSAPYVPHTDHARMGFSLFGRNIFGRDFQCPSGTNSCSNIGSDLCCNSGETCVNTSEGVGCCPNGQTCGDSVAGCDTAAGYTSCPNSTNGGCCMPGAACYQSGCAFYGTLTSVTTLPTVTVTSGTSFTQPRSSTSSAHSTTVIVNPVSYTTIVIISQQGTTVTETVVSPTTIVIVPVTASTCSSGFSNCASSLGGGCCRDGQTCATNSCVDPSSATTSTATAAPPVRPTTSASSSNAPVSAAGTTVTSTQSVATGCPTGYYMCSAVYLGGCCQVDRNCDTTSCPSTATTDIVTSGLTIAAAGGASTCATGWSSCGANVGGGCCPSGYNCGTASCINPQGGGDQAKQTSSSTAVATGFAWSFVLAALGAAVGMIWL